MTNHNENETTDQLPPPSVEARLASLETGQMALQATVNEINAKLDVLTHLQREMLKMQQDMYVDLRGRLSSIERDIYQIKQDIQPDSFQSRLMRMGQ
ncbi:MAG: hypothetical protein ACRD82_14430 [Blastocatellia bacterium]